MSISDDLILWRPAEIHGRRADSTFDSTPVDSHWIEKGPFIGCLLIYLNLLAPARLHLWFFSHASPIELEHNAYILKVNWPEHGSVISMDIFGKKA
jgi:hypothetical protein